MQCNYYGSNNYYRCQAFLLFIELADEKWYFVRVALISI